MFIGAVNLDVADSGMFEKQGVPLQRKINQRGGEKGDRHFAAGLLDVDIMNLIGAAPEMKGHRFDLRAIAGDFGELAIDVVADPDGEIEMQYDNDHESGDDEPEPPAADQPLAGKSLFESRSLLLKDSRFRNHCIDGSFRKAAVVLWQGEAKPFLLGSRGRHRIVGRLCQTPVGTQLQGP